MFSGAVMDLMTSLIDVANMIHTHINNAVSGGCMYGGKGSGQSEPPPTRVGQTWYYRTPYSVYAESLAKIHGLFGKEQKARQSFMKAAIK